MTNNLSTSKGTIQLVAWCTSQETNIENCISETLLCPQHICASGHFIVDGIMLLAITSLIAIGPNGAVSPLPYIIIIMTKGRAALCRPITLRRPRTTIWLVIKKWSIPSSLKPSVDDGYITTSIKLQVTIVHLLPRFLRGNQISHTMPKRVGQHKLHAPNFLSGYVFTTWWEGHEGWNCTIAAGVGQHHFSNN